MIGGMPGGRGAPLLRPSLRAFALAWSVLAGLSLGVAGAGGDSASIDRVEAAVGEQFTVILEVSAPASATVEVDSLADSWEGVEVVAVVTTSFELADGGGVHRLELLAAGFIPESTSFAPAVVVVNDGMREQRQLPTLELHVQSSLPDGAPLLLSPLPEPTPTAGAQSPLLLLAVLAGLLAGLVVLVLLLAAIRSWLRRWWKRRRSKPNAVAPLQPASAVDLAEQLLASDTAEAYRLLGQAVRADITRRYDLPAPALTTGELSKRMASQGVDRWEARLVAGLLEECDSVIYAGYRPAVERINADLGIAREILGGAI